MSAKQEPRYERAVPMVAYKNIGETPLECLERVRAERGIASDVPMTYAGRLDPMAEGLLLLLVGEDCKRKDDFLALDKEYEVEVLFGVATDTGDVLGMSERGSLEVPPTDLHFADSSFSKYIGKFEQKYPAYSSKTVAGKPLHIYAREGNLPLEEEMPTKEVEIYSIALVDSGQTSTISGKDAAQQAVNNIKKLDPKADFRQEQIMAGWEDFVEKFADRQFPLIKIRVTCSSGTYMRSLAERIGRDMRLGSMAYSIKRTKIGSYSV